MQWSSRTHYFRSWKSEKREKHYISLDVYFVCACVCECVLVFVCFRRITMVSFSKLLKCDVHIRSFAVRRLKFARIPEMMEVERMLLVYMWWSKLYRTFAHTQIYIDKNTNNINSTNNAKKINNKSKFLSLFVIIFLFNVSKFLSCLEPKAESTNIVWYACISHSCIYVKYFFLLSFTVDASQLWFIVVI